MCARTMNIHIPTIEDLKRAIHLHEGIEKLRTELISLLGGTSLPSAYTGAKRGRKPRAKAKAADPGSVEGGVIGNAKTAKKAKTKRVMSPEAREKIAAAQRKRWAKAKRAAKKAASE